MAPVRPYRKVIEFQILVKTNRERSLRPWPNMIEITKYVNRIRERVPLYESPIR